MLTIQFAQIDPDRVTFTPQFEGTAEHVAWAEQLWTASAQCAGRPARAADLVPVEVGGLPAHLKGMSTFMSGDVLVGLQVAVPHDVGLLAHEVAHAWYGKGVVAEALTELLSECALSTAGLRPSHAGTSCDVDLRGALPLRLDDPPPRVMAPPDVPMYLRGLAAQALVRGLFHWFEWRDIPGHEPDWMTLAALLPQAQREQLVSFLNRPAGEQAMLLRDLDGDGAPAIHETMLGTRPDRWDTDGDGWWDGAPAGGVGLPLPPVGFSVVRCHARTEVAMHHACGATTRLSVREPLDVTSELRHLDHGDGCGGAWLEAVEGCQVETPTCLESDVAVVCAPAALAGSLHEQVGLAVAGLTTAIGRSPLVAGERVRLSFGAEAASDPVALREAAVSAVARWFVASRGLVPEESATRAVVALIRGRHVPRAWTRLATTCADGWSGLLIGPTCEIPATGHRGDR